MRGLVFSGLESQKSDSGLRGVSYDHNSFDAVFIRRVNSPFQKLGMILGLCMILLFTAGCGEEPVIQAAPGELHAGHDHTVSPFAIIGDTQRTFLVESILLWREDNDTERDILLSYLLQEEFQFLVHLGDMVSIGASEVEWGVFDRLFEPLRQKNIPILPALGNHEYWGYNPEAERRIHDRFPHLKDSNWYTHTYQGIGLIFLDSNDLEYEQATWRRQIEWYVDSLQKMDADTTVRAIVVFSHHPPFTNSMVTGDELHVQEHFLPPFYKSRKTVLMASGHAHGYEHFSKNGKDFVVSGGGGGPRVLLHKKKDGRHDDLFDGPSPRPFNFLLAYPEAEKLRVEVVGLYKKRQQIKVIDIIELSYPDYAARR